MYVTLLLTLLGAAIGYFLTYTRGAYRGNYLGGLADTRIGAAFTIAVLGCVVGLVASLFIAVNISVENPEVRCYGRCVSGGDLTPTGKLSLLWVQTNAGSSGTEVLMYYFACERDSVRRYCIKDDLRRFTVIESDTVTDVTITLKDAYGNVPARYRNWVINPPKSIHYSFVVPTGSVLQASAQTGVATKALPW